MPQGAAGLITAAPLPQGRAVYDTTHTTNHLLKIVRGKQEKRGNDWVVTTGGMRIEMMDRGTRYIWRKGSKDGRESFPGGNVSDGIANGDITTERIAQWQHRSNIRKAKAFGRSQGTQGLDQEYAGVGSAD